MYTYEIVDLSKWLSTNHDALQKAYEPLISVFQNNASGQQQQPIEANLIHLTDFLSDMDLSHLSSVQVEILRNFNVYSAIGPQAAKRVSTRVKELAYDPATVLNELTQATQSISNARNHLQTINHAFLEAGIDITPPTLPEDHLIMWVNFTSEVSIENVSDLKKQSQAWFEILRGIAIAAGQKPEDIIVVRTSKSSPFIIEWAMTAALIRLTSLMIRDICDSITSVLEVRQKLTELAQDQIINELISKGLREIEKERADNAKETVNKKAKQLFKQTLEDGAQNGLEKAIERLMTFFEKGGEVEFKIAKQTESDGLNDAEVSKELADAKEAMKLFRQSSAVLRQLRHDKDN